jgi:Xaa-Pro aminopeptidase
LPTPTPACVSWPPPGKCKKRIKKNLGVRLEDTVIITETGCENPTPVIPRKIPEIEAFIKKK